MKGGWPWSKNEVVPVNQGTYNKYNPCQDKYKNNTAKKIRCMQTAPVGVYSMQQIKEAQDLQRMSNISKGRINMLKTKATVNATVKANSKNAIPTSPRSMGMPILQRQGARENSVFSGKKAPSPSSSRSTSPLPSAPSTPRSSIFMGGKRRTRKGKKHHKH